MVGFMQLSQFARQRVAQAFRICKISLMRAVMSGDSCGKKPVFFIGNVIQHLGAESFGKKV